MARVNGNETDGSDDGGGASNGGIESVNLGEQLAAATAASGTVGGSGTSKRIRRTKAELAAAGYYDGTEKEKRPLPVATAKKGSLDVNSIQFALSGIHALLAVGLSSPELTLSDTEAETVAKNIVAVGRHYDLQQTAKATDWGNLVVSLGVVYGGRFMSIGMRKSAERKAAGRGVNLNPRPVAAAPTQPTVTTPAAGKAAPGMPTTRPKNDADLALLNEQEAFLVP